MIRTKCGNYILIRQPNPNFRRQATRRTAAAEAAVPAAEQPEFFRIILLKEDVAAVQEINMATHGVVGANCLVTMKNGSNHYAAETLMQIFQSAGLEIADPEPVVA